jgi:DNA polymerase I
MDLTDVKRHVMAMEEASLIAVDTETTGIDGIKTGAHYAVGISVAYRLGPLGIFSAYFPLRHNEGENLPLQETLDLLKPVLRKKPLVFHNHKFDLFSLKTLGITEFDAMHFDTYLMSKLCNEEYPSAQLDWLGKKILNKGKDRSQLAAWIKMYGWGDVPANIMEDYAKVDAEITLELCEYFWQEMARQELQDLWPDEIAFNTLLYDMESRGVGVNVAFCEAKLKAGEQRMAEIESILSFEPSKPSQLAKFFFEDLGMPVLKRSTKTGKPSMDKHVMQEYDEMLAATNNPVARLVLEYRGWQKACSSLYAPMLERNVNGVVRANFNQGGTKTGRLSCDSPNLQQIPRKTEQEWNGDAKQAFNAGDDDYDLIGYDYSQLELRLATAYGQEERLINEFLKDDADPFTAYKDVIGCTRQETKTFFYSNIYGAGTAKIAYTLGRPLDEVRPLHARFIDSIPGITRASKRANELADSRKYVRYWTGRRRHFPYGENTYRAFNSILQGGAAELVKQAMLNMRQIENEDIQMVLQVHDEIVFRVRRGTLDKYDARIREIMTDFPQFGVRFTVEPKVWNA